MKNNEGKPAHAALEELSCGSGYAEIKPEVEINIKRKVNEVNLYKPKRWIKILLCLACLTQIGYSIVVFTNLSGVDLPALFVIANVYRMIFILIAHWVYCFGRPIDEEAQVYFITFAIIYAGLSIAITACYWFGNLSIENSRNTTLIYAEVIFNTAYSALACLFIALNFLYCLIKPTCSET